MLAGTRRSAFSSWRLSDVQRGNVLVASVCVSLCLCVMFYLTKALTKKIDFRYTQVYIFRYLCTPISRSSGQC